MSDIPDLPELEELEPLTEDPSAVAQAASAQAAAMPQPQMAQQMALPAGPGLPPPAWNPNAGKQYYRFMMGGLFMILGCLMPFGANQPSAMHSIEGCFYLFIALGMTWSWWGAIHTNKFSGKNLIWLLLCLVPLLGNVIHAMGVFNTWSASLVPDAPESLGDFFSSIGGTFGGDTDEARAAQAAYVKGIGLIGPGRVVVLFGAALSLLFFVQGVFGGAKTAKAQKQARKEAASSRRKR